MSAFAVLFTPSSTPDTKMFERVMQLMSHRGPDGYDKTARSRAILGHWHFWVTPEEQSERQPLGLKDTSLTIVFDGRIDNRDEVFDRLSVAPHERDISDASLFLMAYKRWQEDCFKYFIGEFALVIFDEKQNRLVCARDPLGERSLFYSANNTQTIIASESWAVANASKPVLDERSAIHYLAAHEPGNNDTMFEGVNEIPPAHFLIITAEKHLLKRYWYPDLEKQIRYKSDSEYGEHFFEVLAQCVHSRLRSSGPVGAFMSGGLDSPSVVAIAAQQLMPQQLTTFTHVFDDETLQKCDERKYVNEMANMYSLRSIQIPCDDAWVLKDWQKLPVDRNHPEINAYRWIKEREYERVQKEGIRVLLTGSFGDTLYAAGVEWLIDLLTEGQIVQALQEMLWLLQHVGWRRNWRVGYLQSTIKYLLRKLSITDQFGYNSTVPVWLSRQAKPYSPRQKPAKSPKNERAEILFERWIAIHQTVEASYASRHQVELRYPYRDRRLIEFILGLPAYQLYFHGLYKHILRTAMKNKLPESIRTRRDITSLTPFFLYGMKKEEENIKRNIQDVNAPWRPFIDGDWLNSYNSAAQNVPVTIPWLLMSYTRWARTVFEN